MISLLEIFDPSRWPIQLERFSMLTAAVVYLLLAVPVVWLGMRAMRWGGAWRHGVALGVRLVLLWILILILGDARFQQTHRDVEVVVLKDVSSSVSNAAARGGEGIHAAIDRFVQDQFARSARKPDDKIGLVRFGERALIESLPATVLIDAAGAIQSERFDGTDIPSAIQVGLTSFSGHAMKRLVLVSDGNNNMGDLDAALNAAIAANVPIDVVPLRFRVDREVMLDRVIVPRQARMDSSMPVEVIVRSTHAAAVSARLSIMHQGMPMDLDADSEGIQPTLRVNLNAGANVFRFRTPLIRTGGLHEIRAIVESDRSADDTLLANNAAGAFAMARGRGGILYVDNELAGHGGALNSILAAQLPDYDVRRITPDQFPERLLDLQSYDAVILANVPRGVGGLTIEQDRMLSHYVRETGGGLVMIGGPDALGAGNWQNSEVEKILPVTLDVPAERVLPAGALVMVIDHSGSMHGAMPGDPNLNKQQVAVQSAVLALKALQPGDLVGVVGFDANASWIVRLGPNANPSGAIREIQTFSATGGGTNIGPALEEAIGALERLPKGEVSVRRILLLTDGQSNPFDAEGMLQRMAASKIAISTVGVGGDIDRNLLAFLAKRGDGRFYTISDPNRLVQVFLQEASMLRRNLISEPPEGIAVAREPGLGTFGSSWTDDSVPSLRGMVLTTARRSPFVQVPLRAANRYGDPVLAFGQSELGRAAVFTGDATPRWSSAWMGDEGFATFWTNIVRSVSRAGGSTDFEIATVREGDRTKILVESPNFSEVASRHFNLRGKLMMPDQGVADVKLLQTGPGRYEGYADTPQPGSYAAVVQYTGPQGERGVLTAGVNVDATAESRDLASNESALDRIAVRTGGRVYPGLAGAAMPDFYACEGLRRSASSLPIQSLLLVSAIAMMIVDVAVRRIALDWTTVVAFWMFCTAFYYRWIVTSTNAETGSGRTLGALKRVREAQSSRLQIDVQSPLPVKPLPAAARPMSQRREASSVQTNSLLAAKRRAQRQIRQKEQE